ncbi:MAG: MFS transporter [Armatimonadota bacterium]
MNSDLPSGEPASTDTTQGERLLSQQQVAHALRHFIIMGMLWAIYGPNATVSGPVLSGFGLKYGLSQAQIGFLASFVSLFGLWQIVSAQLTRAVPNKRRLCVGLGMAEITAASLVISTALLPQGARFYAMAGLLSVAYLLGHTVNPIFNSWMSNVLPAEVRGPYIGRRMMFVSITSIAYLYAASRWLDWRSDLAGFVAVYAVGWLAGVLGYVMMALTSYPRVTVEEPQGVRGALAGPLRDRSYRALVLFMVTWLGAGMMSGAFYAVYMLQDLRLSYAQVAIYTNITLLLMMVSYVVWGIFVQRFGSRPVTQLTIIPYVGALAMWVFVSPTTYAWLIPIQRALAGACWAGVEIANSSLLYKLVPSGRENSSYFANWMVFVAIGSAGGPFVGGVIREALPEAGVDVLGLHLAPLQVVFAISALCTLVPVALSFRLRETEATSPLYLLGQFRGNLLGYAYNYAMYSVALSEDRRAEAARGLGRSHTPLAMEKLVGALKDVSPQVRSEAARSLGEMGLEEAVGPLVDRLHDEESDIRPEAAEALGKIGSAHSVRVLAEALDDDDPRVRTSAALALGEIGGEEAQRALYERLTGRFEKSTFAALVDGSSRTGDLRIVEPVLEHLPSFRSPVLRMQIINGVCRVLGEPRHFYRLLMADRLTRAGMTESMTARIVRLLQRAPGLEAEVRQAVVRLARLFRAALAEDDFVAAAQHARKLATVIARQPGVPEVSAMAAVAIRRYVDDADPELLPDEGAIFLVLCLTALARYLYA